MVNKSRARRKDSVAGKGMVIVIGVVGTTRCARGGLHPVVRSFVLVHE